MRFSTAIYTGYRMYKLDVNPERLDNVYVLSIGASFLFDLAFLF